MNGSFEHWDVSFNYRVLTRIIEECYDNWFSELWTIRTKKVGIFLSLPIPQSTYKLLVKLRTMYDYVIFWNLVYIEAQL